MSQQTMQLEIILQVSGPGMPHYYRFSLTMQPTNRIPFPSNLTNKFLSYHTNFLIYLTFNFIHLL